MNKQEAEKVVIEDLLIQSVKFIEFLDKCLKKEADYAYPEQTEDFLTKVNNTITMPNMYCYHSQYVSDCLLCNTAFEYRLKLHKAREVLKENEHRI